KRAIPRTTPGPAARPAATSSGCGAGRARRGAGPGVAGRRVAAAAPPLISTGRARSHRDRRWGRRGARAGEDLGVARPQGLAAVGADHLLLDPPAAAAVLEAHRR